MEPRITVTANGKGKPKVGAGWRPMIIALAVALLMAFGAAIFWRFTFFPASPPLGKVPQQGIENKMCK